MRLSVNIIRKGLLTQSFFIFRAKGIPGWYIPSGSMAARPAVSDLYSWRRLTAAWRFLNSLRIRQAGVMIFVHTEIPKNSVMLL